MMFEVLQLGRRPAAERPDPPAAAHAAAGRHRLLPVGGALGVGGAGVWGYTDAKVGAAADPPVEAAAAARQGLGDPGVPTVLSALPRVPRRSCIGLLGSLEEPLLLPSARRPPGDR